MTPHTSFHSASSKILALLLLSSGIGISGNSGNRNLPTAEGCPSQEHFIAIADAAPRIPSPVAPDFTVTVGPGLIYKVNGVTNAPLTLVRGQTYTFDLTAVPSFHPFIINSNQNDNAGTIYSGPSSATTIMFTPDQVMPATIYYHCNVHFTVMHASITLVSPPLQVAVKAFLEGPYNTGTLLMDDGLRSLGFVPTTEPYTAIGYTHVGGGGETTSLPVLAAVGSNAIVDWVEVEMRDPTTPTIRLATKSALIQCDGDVVSASDGVSPLQFSLSPGNYQVALRHRSHLGIMTASALTFGASVVNVDFTTVATACFGTNARKTVGAVQAMWMGDSGFDGVISYTGTGNDRDPILVAIGGTVPTNTVAGYLITDLNMDGAAKYTGTGNDRDPILVNIGGVVPTNTRLAQLP